MSRRLVACVLVAWAADATAQPAEPPPLAQIRDDDALARTLAAITQDPAITVDDPARRTRAQALMIEGVKRLQAKEYDQALANFLDAYAKFPSPKILLNIASTLRDMGRLSDAANTYQRYLLDPITGNERITEVKDILLALDRQLTVLTIRIAPAGARVSIDAGPFVEVGASLQVRVRPGLHLVRLRHGERTTERTVNGFEGELKDVELALDDTPPPAPASAAPPTQAWLADSERYGTADATSNERVVLSRPNGPPVAAFVPRFETADEVLVVTANREGDISSGVITVLRIDGEGRGFAGGIGFAIARGRFEGDLMLLRSNQTGGYLGVRYRILGGFFRPYVGAGMPGWSFEHRAQSDGPAEQRFALGVRGAAGLELFINGHLSVQADLGYEHFWFVDNTRFDPSIWIPTVGVIGRL